MKATDDQIVDYIRGYIREHGYSPSLREIGDAIGVKSVGSVKYRMNSLKEKGLVTFADRKPRTIKVIGA